MIIHDTPLHKVDLELIPQSDGAEAWTQLTTFHRKNVNDADWYTKVIRLNPASCREMEKWFLKQYGEDKDK